MTQFKDREQAFESNFKREQELDFKISARRNKLLGLWAATQLGLDDDSAAAYAKEVVVSDFDEPGDDDVLQKVVGDLQGKKVDISEHLVRKEMDRLRGAVHDLGWQVDRLHERQVERLQNLEQRLDFAEQLIGRPAAPLEARH